MLKKGSFNHFKLLVPKSTCLYDWKGFFQEWKDSERDAVTVHGSLHLLIRCDFGLLYPFCPNLLPRWQLVCLLL